MTPLFTRSVLVPILYRYVVISKSAAHTVFQQRPILHYLSGKYLSLLTISVQAKRYGTLDKPHFMIPIFARSVLAVWHQYHIVISLSATVQPDWLKSHITRNIYKYYQIHTPIGHYYPSKCTGNNDC